ACGLVVAGRAEGRAYVLADLTLERARPASWARAAARAYHRYGADRLVAEVNQGGDLVESVLRQVDAGSASRKARASRGPPRRGGCRMWAPFPGSRTRWRTSVRTAFPAARARTGSTRSCGR